MGSVTRCAARTRTSNGWERCHGDHTHAGPHHASDRTWTATWLRFNLGCDCQPDDTVTYYGAPVLLNQPGASRSAWPKPWTGPKEPWPVITPR